VESEMNPIWILAVLLAHDDAEQQAARREKLRSIFPVHMRSEFVAWRDELTDDCCQRLWDSWTRCEELKAAINKAKPSILRRWLTGQKTSLDERLLRRTLLELEDELERNPQAPRLARYSKKDPQKFQKRLETVFQGMSAEIGG
jgi:hypothetical protein